jgi:hypothetical protein
MPTIIDYLLLTVITIFPVLSLGIMLFFSFVIAPTVHKFLPTAQSGPYIRRLFPIYYIINAALALGSLIAIASLGVFNAIFYANVIIFVLFALCYFYLMPTINKQKVKNNRKFKILHSGSIVINLIQIILLISITVVLLDF